MEELNDRIAALMERVDRMLSALEPQITAAIERENERFAAIEARLVAVEDWQRARSDGNVASQNCSTYAERALARAVEVLNTETDWIARNPFLQNLKRDVVAAHLQLKSSSSAMSDSNDG